MDVANPTTRYYSYVQDPSLGRKLLCLVEIKDQRRERERERSWQTEKQVEPGNIKLISSVLCCFDVSPTQPTAPACIVVNLELNNLHVAISSYTTARVDPSIYRILSLVLVKKYTRATNIYTKKYEPL